MSYDKIKSDGTTIEAPQFTYRVLDSVPVIFQLAEWLLVIVAFQYVDVRFGFIAAKVAWLALSLALATYVGVLSSNLLWRFVEDPFKTRKWRVFTYYIAPLLSGAMIYGLQYLVRLMVSAQQG